MHHHHHPYLLLLLLRSSLPLEVQAVEPLSSALVGEVETQQRQELPAWLPVVEASVDGVGQPSF